VAFWSIVGGGGALAVGLGVLLVVMVRRGRRGGQDGATLPPGLPPTPFPGYGYVPAQAPAPAPAWHGTSPRDATVDLGTLNAAQPAPAAVITAPREDCTRCGTRLAAGAHFCSTCGQARS
jgi:hypothetical protein